MFDRPLLGLSVTRVGVFSGPNMSQQVKTIFGCQFLAIVVVVLENDLKVQVLSYSGRHTIPTYQWVQMYQWVRHMILWTYSDKPGMAKRDNKSNPCLVVATSYDSYQAEHGEAACLAVLASDDRGPTPIHTIWPCLAGQ